MRVIDLSGKRFGRLSVLMYSHSFNRRKYWVCKCDCGKDVLSYTNLLLSGKVRSCGCLAIELKLKRSLKHGLATKNRTTSDYDIWCHIKARCFNKNEKSYKHYGGRGITMCDEWKNDFYAFYSYMGARPSNIHTVDRINTNGNYEPGNCRWATQKEQQNNRRNNHIIEYDGVSLTISQWSEKINIKQPTIRRRLKMNWSAEKTLLTPLKHHK
jgi:hypothetical protein